MEEYIQISDYTEQAETQLTDVSLIEPYLQVIVIGMGVIIALLFVVVMSLGLNSRVR